MMSPFWKGFCSIFNLFGTPPKRRKPKSWQEAFEEDWKQIENDWKKVIGDWKDKENKL